MKTILWLALTLPLAAQTPAPAPPKTAAAVAGPWVKNVTLPAEALPYFRVHVGSPATGWVREVRADIGSRVKKGELLAAIHAPELTAAAEARAEETRAAKQRIAQAASLLRSAEASAAAARSESDRISRLAATGTVTSKARDEAEARSHAAAAKVGEAEAAMAGAEAESLAAAARQTEAEAALEYTQLTAPFDGLVVERQANLGDFLGSDSVRQKLFVLEQTDPLRVRLHVPEHAAALTGAGDPVTLKLGGREFAAKLNRVSGSLDPITRTLTAEIDLTGTGLMPGTFGSATIAAAKLDEAVIIPLAALRTEADGSRFVTVLNGSTETKVPATLFATDGQNAILAAGPDHGADVLIP
jgi:HlyD family secretion protein